MNPITDLNRGERVMKTKQGEALFLGVVSLLIAIAGVTSIEYFDQTSIGVILLMWSNNIGNMKD